MLWWCRYRWRWQQQQYKKFQRHNYQNKLKCNISDCIINEKNAHSIKSQVYCVSVAHWIDSLAQSVKCKKEKKKKNNSSRMNEPKKRRWHKPAFHMHKCYVNCSMSQVKIFYFHLNSIDSISEKEKKNVICNWH